MGDTNDDGHHSKRHLYDTKCGEARKLWRQQSVFDEYLESEHG